jgi:sterol desaturase/sphingolipid hydroxylase (fatty acid hydroxylase superfamily)
MTVDPTVVAIPGYFASMAWEHRWLKAHAAERGLTAGEYTRSDTVASLSMGVISLATPFVMPRLLGRFAPNKAPWGRVLLATAAGAVVVTTVADQVVRRLDAIEPTDDTTTHDTTTDDTTTDDATTHDRRRAIGRIARKVASIGGVTAIVAGGVSITTALSTLTPDWFWARRRSRRDLGGGLVPLAASIVAWDFIYYWNHRLMHEARYMWAVHVVHHSSEHYNLSTALRQPVAYAFGTFIPQGVVCWFGIPPGTQLVAGGLNLLYQYWIHTETVPKLGAAEEVLNTPSHHRVHHGSNRQYLDRNHGSILIVWDRLFGTFEREDERVAYGLTTNIDTFNPWRIATCEHASMLRDVSRSTTWRDRLSFVVRGPGWAYGRHAEDGLVVPGDERAHP